MTKISRNNSGNVLITLLIFIAVAITVTTGAVTTSIINSQGISEQAQGETAFQAAEAGLETAIIRLLRERTYAGESLTIGQSAVTITVSGTSPVTIISESTYNKNTRKLQAEGEFTGGVFSITNWKEIE